MCDCVCAELYVFSEKPLAATEAGGSHWRPEGLFRSVAHASQVTGQAEATWVEAQHMPAADAQVRNLS